MIGRQTREAVNEYNRLREQKIKEKLIEFKSSKISERTQYDTLKGRVFGVNIG